MKRFFPMRTCLLLLALLVCWPAGASVRKRKNFVRHTADSAALALPVPPVEMPTRSKMSSSAFPVSISVSGRSVQIKSSHEQFLPIYTRSGALYLTARLNKGTNWLGGLPRGHYFINNLPVTIN